MDDNEEDEFDEVGLGIVLMICSDSVSYIALRPALLCATYVDAI